MQKWEYWVVYLNVENEETAMAILNNAGEQGWELVSLYQTRGVFKRRKL